MNRNLADKIRTRAWVIRRAAIGGKSGGERGKSGGVGGKSGGVGAVRLKAGTAARLTAGTAALLIIILSPVWLTSGGAAPYANRVAEWSIRHQIGGMILSPPPEVSDSAVSVEAGSPSDADEHIQENQPEENQTEPPPDESTADLAPVKEVTMPDEGDGFGGVYVRNTTKNQRIDISQTLRERPECKIKLDAGYQVLIIHTHTTECYSGRADGFYDRSVNARTTDKSKSVVAVGAAVAKRLNDAGIRTLHITAMHDYPAYNGSYERAAQTIAETLRQHPSIEMVIDVHRDSMTLDDGSKYKPTALIDDKKAAQVMIISGCDDNGRLDFPGWQKNLRMGLRLQQQMASDYPGLARPLNFAPFRYNMHLTPNSLLIEFGSDVNTLDEAVYSGDLVGKSLVKVLLGFAVN
ncbi:MAG: stage II sporulation protein P [Oscillospiraceae bacterium]|nr:stage II sporulation protein P [Oscillospiraceae bacterium]